MASEPHQGAGVAQVYHDPETGNYVAETSEGATILGAEAGALNLFGRRAAISRDSRVFFGPTHEWRTEPDMHADGVLFIEEA